MLGLFVVIAAACSSSGDDDSGPVSQSTEVPETGSTSPAPERDEEADDSADNGTDGGGDEGSEGRGSSLLQGAELGERLAELGGQLALTNGREIAVARPDGQAFQILGAGDESAAQPTWSREGTALAWNSSSVDGHSVLIQSFDADGLPDGEPVVSEIAGFPVFYLQWSGDDRRLAFLRGASEPGLVDFGFIEPGRPAESVDQSTPFFISWSPGSGQVLAHVGQRTVGLYDPEAPGDERREVLAQGDDYTAPAWIDDERALVIADDALAIVTVADGAVEALEPAEGPIRFVLSPDRRRVAYRSLNDPSQGPLTANLPSPASSATPTDQGGLVVLDLESGERQVVTDEPAAAWEWSPDGSRLAWLSLRERRGVIGHWSFWTADGSELVTGRTPEFGLSRTYAEIYLPFFAQYAQSVTGWAPDSSAYAFAGNVAGDRGVHIQLIDDAADAVQVSGGDFVTWGPGPTPEPSLGASAA